MSATPIETRCVIAGGGPAGMMLGFLLSRAGVDCIVLEKHADFLRDFRGDTIHPSTLSVMKELGLIDRFLALPHQSVKELTAVVGSERFKIADFSRLATPVPRLLFMPQWDFLDFLANEGKENPPFKLMMKTEVTGLVENGGVVSGVNAQTADGPVEIHAGLVVAADGRHSTLRPAAKLQPIDIGAPMDVLWFSLPREAADDLETGGYFVAGAVFVTIDRGDHWQCGFVIEKGGFDKLRAEGLDDFRARIAAIVPTFTNRLAAIASFGDVKLLTVGVDRLTCWHKPGLLLIGDAAHTMSPVGGVGINLAIQDAVAAANLLGPKLRAGSVSEADLARVQKRREFPTRVTQAAQLFVQNRIISRLLDSDTPPRAAWPLRLLNAVPWLRQFPARAVGLGVRPEHVEFGRAD